MEITNKTLATMLVVAILFSVGSTLFTLYKIDNANPTGMVVTGITNLSVISFASLNVVDGVINFGACTPIVGGVNISSNETSTSICTFPNTAPDVISIENDGNVDINISIQTSKTAAQFIGGTNPAPKYWFDSENGTAPGCMRNLSTTWVEFLSSSVNYRLCGNLSGNRKNINMTIMIQLPEDVPVVASTNATLTFTATQPTNGN